MYIDPRQGPSNRKQRDRRDQLLAALRAIPKDMSDEEGVPLVIAAFQGLGHDLWIWFDEGLGYRTLSYTNETDIFARVRRIRNDPREGHGRALFAAINAKPKKTRKAA